MFSTRGTPVLAIATLGLLPAVGLTACGGDDDGGEAEEAHVAEGERRQATVESPGEIGEGGFGAIETINVEVDGEIIEAKLDPDVLGTTSGPIEFTVGECVNIESGVYYDNEGEPRGSEDEWIVVSSC